MKLAVIFVQEKVLLKEVNTESTGSNDQLSNNFIVSRISIFLCQGWSIWFIWPTLQGECWKYERELVQIHVLCNLCT